eukprot:4268780-Amphidinium_carterae.1
MLTCEHVTILLHDAKTRQQPTCHNFASRCENTSATDDEVCALCAPSRFAVIPVSCPAGPPSYQCHGLGVTIPQIYSVFDVHACCRSFCQTHQ